MCGTVLAFCAAGGIATGLAYYGIFADVAVLKTDMAAVKQSLAHLVVVVDRLRVDSDKGGLRVAAPACKYNICCFSDGDVHCRYLVVCRSG